MCTENPSESIIIIVKSSNLKLHACMKNELIYSPLNLLEDVMLEVLPTHFIFHM